MISIINTDAFDNILLNEGILGLKTHAYNKYAGDQQTYTPTQLKINVHLYSYLKAVAHVKGVHPHKILEEILVDHISKEVNTSKFY